MKIAVFPGSFDPITKGHVDLVLRALSVFDTIYVAVGVNDAKKYLFDLDQRIKWLEEIFAKEERVKIGYFDGLTVDYCRSVKANFLLRGLRNAADFDYEKTISQLNFIIGDELETVFLISKPEYSHISSTIVREIIKGGGNVKDFVPEVISRDVMPK